ncbi:resuscitation-promoting factor [Isoptericola jiangsuensis]|uniref:resuscitation-promoting factor n=1 Tax=Isoptericola jiangsuensis TaxID=548579 RepID=UPI002481C55F|nr:resuscitation-promoting factor [Isoptericola jiangsuensis]
MNDSTVAPQPVPDDASTVATETTAAAAPRRRRWPFVTLAVTLGLALTAGIGAAVADQLRKDITLDVDGQLTRVSTYAATVSDALAEEGVRVGADDEVTPAAGEDLRDGAVVQVRYGRELTVETDGEEQDVVVAALDAADALDQLADRDEQVRLLPSRSDERAVLPLRLDADEPVALVVGGEETVVADGAVSLEDLLAAEGVTLDADDIVHVDRIAAAGPTDPTVRVVVQRVDVEKVTTTKKIAFDTVTKQDPDRYEDQGSYVATEGRKGVRTTVHRVTTVDGEVTEREKISSEVTRKARDKVIVEGTKERPEPEPEPAPTSSSSSSSSSSGSSSGSSGGSAPSGVWAALAQCESGGNPATNTGNGYYGLYQFSLPTWQAMGGSGLPSDASASEQTMRAQKLQAQSGWGQWPACAAKLGLL